MSAFRTGRPLGVDTALMLARRATFDPGEFTARVLYCEGEPETLERWQARAVLVALAADADDSRWSNTAPHVTEYERAELDRVLPGAEGVAVTVTEDVAQALAAAALGAQGTALHYAGYYATLADRGRYSDSDREALRGRASHQVEIAEHLHTAAVALGEALGTTPVVEIGAAA